MPFFLTSALLWHRLMGKEVLATSHDGPPNLRAYSHCSRNHVNFVTLQIQDLFFLCHSLFMLKPIQKLLFLVLQPGITLLLINLSNSTFFNATITEDFDLFRKPFESKSQREEYH